MKRKPPPWIFEINQANKDREEGKIEIQEWYNRVKMTIAANTSMPKDVMEYLHKSYCEMVAAEAETKKEPEPAPAVERLIYREAAPEPPKPKPQEERAGPPKKLEAPF